MRHTSQKNLKINKVKALLVNNNIKEAVAYAKEKGITPEEFGKISKSLKLSICMTANDLEQNKLNMEK
jgi:hypothetical protein